MRRNLQQRLSDQAFDIISGSTDSERVFAAILDNLEFSEDGASLADMVEAVQQALSQVHEQCREAGVSEHTSLNRAVTDGIRSVVTRYIDHEDHNCKFLFYKAGSQFECDETGTCRLVVDTDQRDAVVVSSELLRWTKC